MSPVSNTQFDVVGAGYVSEHHDDHHNRYLSDSDQGAIGVASAWLAFYVTAAAVVVVSNLQKAAAIVVASN